jgi:hypothetical protein
MGIHLQMMPHILEFKKNVCKTIILKLRVVPGNFRHRKKIFFRPEIDLSDGEFDVKSNGSGPKSIRRFLVELWPFYRNMV